MDEVTIPANYVMSPDAGAVTDMSLVLLDAMTLVGRDTVPQARQLYEDNSDRETTVLGTRW